MCIHLKIGYMLLDHPSERPCSFVAAPGIFQRSCGLANVPATHDLAQGRPLGVGETFRSAKTSWTTLLGCMCSAFVQLIERGCGTHPCCVLGIVVDRSIPIRHSAI